MATWTAAGGGMPRFRFLSQVSHYLVRYATWIPPLIWFNAYVAEVTFINGPSMYPFFNPQYNESLRKDLCLVWKMYAQEGLRRGMIVTFRSVFVFSLFFLSFLSFLRLFSLFYVSVGANSPSETPTTPTR